MITVFHIRLSQPGCPAIDHPSAVEGALFLGKSPLPGLAVVRSRDGGASVFNLASAVHAGYPPIVLEDRPLSLGEAMDLPWHTSGRIYDHGRVRGDVVTVCFQRVRGVQLNNPLQLPRIRALLERGGRSIAQNAREERWRRRAEAVCMGLHPRLGQGSGIGLLDPAILLWILGDSFPNPVDRGRVLPVRFLKINPLI
jgi:hypothetical protein